MVLLAHRKFQCLSTDISFIFSFSKTLVLWEMLPTKRHPIFRHLQINIVDVFVPSRKCSLEKMAKMAILLLLLFQSCSMRKYLVFLSDTFSWSPKNGILPRKFVKNGVWSTTYDLVAAAVGVTEIQAFKRFNTRLQFFLGCQNSKLYICHTLL